MRLRELTNHMLSLGRVRPVLKQRMSFSLSVGKGLSACSSSHSLSICVFRFERQTRFLFTADLLFNCGLFSLPVLVTFVELEASFGSPGSPLHDGAFSSGLSKF